MELKFRKKPLVIEAFQMTEERRTNNADWPNWLHEAWMLDREAPGSLYPTEEGTGDGRLSIGTLEGQHLVSWGDWIIQGVHGELYPCKPDIFAKTYEPAEASPASAPEGWKWRRHARTRWEAVGHWDSIEEMAYNDMLGRGWDVEKLYSHAAPTPPVSEDRWLPIATAPKDRFVLLAGPSGYTTIETVFATGRMCSDYHVGRWIDHANDDLTDWGFEPTHWMPLPKAPAMQEDKP